MSMVWKPIPGFSRYEISDTGKVRSVGCKTRKSGYVHTGARDKDGYLHVLLVSDKNVRLNPTVHRLVASTFIRPVAKGEVVRHVNGDKNDNTPENLSIGQVVDNARDAIVHGTQVHGSEVHSAQLDEDEVQTIITMHRMGYRIADLVKVFRVSRGIIKSILGKRTWNHVWEAVEHA